MLLYSENKEIITTVNEKIQPAYNENLLSKISRILLKCCTIIRNIENLNSMMAFDETCKILLIKKIKDENPEGEIAQLYEKINAKEDIIQSLFEKTKSYNFYSIYDSTDKIRIKPQTLKQVLFELDSFNLTNLSDSEKGLVFETFLTTIVGNQVGEMFTPRNIVDYMVATLDPKEGDRICDPCCGSGGFLVKSYEYVKKQIENLELNEYSKPYEMNKLSKNYTGIDINQKTIETAKMNLCMHGMTRSNIHHQDGLLNSNEISKNQFDVIFAQPPFGLKYDSTSFIYQEYYLNKYKKFEALFIERCLNLLIPGGRMGIILPEGILMNPLSENIRNYIESQAKIIKITSLPENTFPNTAIKTSIIFFQKFSTEEKKNADIVKSNFDYKVLFADIKNVGITSRSSQSDTNQLPLLIKEYKNFLSNSDIGNQTLLQQTSYAQMQNWSVSYLKNIVVEKVENYPYFKIGSLLNKNIKYITIEDSEEYNRVTVKLHNQGVFLRDKVLGQDIGTKRQIRIAKRQLIISKIGASSGAIGIVPDNLDNAVVTSDFLTYTIKTDLVEPNYLELLLSTEKFMAYFEELASGSVIKRMNEDLFLNIEIPLPPLSEQIKLCHKIVQLKKDIANLESKFKNEKKVFKNTLFGN